MTALSLFFLFLALPQVAVAPPADAASVFERGQTWDQFLDGAQAQRALWLKTNAAVTVQPDLVTRLARVARGLQLVVVAEDWCPDSAYSVPYVARLAASAEVPIRIVNRTAGEPLMRAHPTSDGRTATPTIVVLRNGRDVGAWVERPMELQELFRSMATNPDNARRFGERGAWYESDRGMTVLAEILTLIERTSETP
jgi:hypothetical protein